MLWIIYLFSRLDKKEKKINPKNNDNKCFQYLVTVPLNYEEVESHPERVTNIKLFINKYKWKGIKYSSKIDDSKTFEKNNPVFGSDVLYIKRNKYIQFIFKKIELMIPNKEK